MIASARRLGSCAELTPGDLVQARRDGVLHFTGRVAEMLPTHGLFWAVSDTGDRRIIEFEEFKIQSVGEPARPDMPLPTR